MKKKVAVKKKSTRVKKIGPLRAFFDNDPSKWTKGYYAKTAEDCPIGAYSNNAVCFCLLGGTQKLGLVLEEVHKKLVPIIQKLYPDRDDPSGIISTIAYFNDHPDTTFEDIKKVLKAANI